MGFEEKFKELLEQHSGDYDICGAISTKGKIYPFGSDTKVLSTIFELFSRPIIEQFAKENGYEVIEPEKQNHYPDFTLQKGSDDRSKIAIDVKTTYRLKEDNKFKYTLGGYTSFIRNNTKNIVFPFDQYQSHWVLGYVYTRVVSKKSAINKIYTCDEIGEIDVPYKNVEVFFQEKWKISGDKAGSGNTTNIGSISGKFKDFIDGNTPFHSDEEFLEYWKNYERTAKERKDKFSCIEEFRIWKETT